MKKVKGGILWLFVFCVIIVTYVVCKHDYYYVFKVQEMITLCCKMSKKIKALKFFNCH